MCAKMLSDASTWSPKLSELIKASQVSLLPFELELDYDYWNYRMYVVQDGQVFVVEPTLLIDIAR